MNVKNIAILGTGGTIAGKSASASDNVGYTAAELGIAELIEAIPGLESFRGTFVEQVAQIDSKDMTFSIWAALAERVSCFLQREDVDGIVITHGTDTLEETAYFLHALLRPGKPVVFACAMRPATALCPDGPQNLVDAITVASYAGASGVLAVCAGTIHGARDVQKAHPYRLDAFSSGDSGAIGFIEDGKLRLVRNWPPAQDLPAVDAMNRVALPASEDLWPRVEIVIGHAGADGRIVDVLLATGVQGIVVACTGNGTLHAQLDAALQRARNAGISVVLTTRCAEGPIVGKSSNAHNTFSTLSPVKARIALILELLAAKRSQSLPAREIAGVPARISSAS